MFTLGILHSTIREEEKLILAAAKKRGIKTQLIDIREEVFNPVLYRANFELALERSVSTVKGLYTTKFLESLGITVINSSKVTSICEDKFFTSLALQEAQVPTPQFALVFGIEQAKQACKQLGGFPVVLKPSLGSWGRLLAKVNDSDSLEAVIEHKDVLGSPYQKVIYIQKYIDKPGRDIRAFVIDNKVICAIYRNSSHWITNTARGGIATNCPLTAELRSISKKVSEAIGGGILAIDIFETNNGLSINEINHTMEFKNSEAPTHVSISGAIVDYCISQYKKL